MALANMGFNDKFGLILEDQNRREREKGEQKERRRGRGRRWRSQDQANKVWNFEFCMETNLDYGFYEIMYEFPCLVG